MTDEQIIKALECCTKGTTSDVCVDCPLRTTDICTEEENGVLKLALDLINSQKAEIERLEQEKGQFEADVEMFTDIGKMYSELKAEAKKEFADMMIQKIVNTPTKFESSYYMYRQGIAYRQDEIIDIIKEMSGDEA